MGNCLTLEEFIEVLFKFLPPWWADSNPILNSILAGFGTVGVFIYCSLVYIKLQTRITTATDEFLDFIAQDFFGDLLIRCPDETDDIFRTKILQTLLEERVTPLGMYNALVTLTGTPPIIWEGFTNAGFYDHSFLDYTAVAGTIAPYQAWIIAYRPTPIVNNITAYLDNTSYADADSYYGGAGQDTTCVSDSDILNCIEITKPLGTLMHVKIEPPVPPSIGGLLQEDLSFFVQENGSFILIT